MPDQSSTNDSQEQPWTVLRLLEWTTKFFQSRHSPSPRLDAEVLLAHARGCERIELYTAFAAIPDNNERQTFRELVRRRGEGVPVAYLVGYREFYSLRFRVDPHVLIPRPETEHLVIAAIDLAAALRPADRELRIIDVGTGSGAIAISLATHLRTANLTATEIDPAALDVARDNANTHQVADRIQFVTSDLFDAIDEDQPFDLICSNPPYVSEAEYTELSPSVREHEPKTALVSGPNGTEIIERLLALAPDRLVPGGSIVLELSPMIAASCLQIANANESLIDARLSKDLSGHHRVLSAKRR